MMVCTVHSQKTAGPASPEQEGANWNIDSIFDAPPGDGEGYTETEEQPLVLRDRVRLEAAYTFLAGFAPGWFEAPWYDGDRAFSYVLGARMEALLSMDFQMSDSLRVWNSFSFSVPDNTVFSIKEFYFDYNMEQKFFLRAGIYEIAWGISRFYPFTNLPARIPPAISAGRSYNAKFNIPIGIGGIELLGMTRDGFMQNSASPAFDEIAYGGKYNLAFEKADIDAGFFYYSEMPLRFFLSLKTTVGDTELYTEGLGSTLYEEDRDAVYLSGNIGFVRDFLGGKLTISGELFYNGETDAAWWRSKTDTLDEDAVDLYQGLNGALAFVFRPGIIGMRIFSQCLYSLDENSAWLIPGVSIKPGNTVTVSLSVPMALGSRNGYYRHNTDKNNRPFSIMLGVTLGGSFRYSL